MPGIFRGPFCDCALWSLWEVFCWILGSAGRFMASHSSVVWCDFVLVFELRESFSLGWEFLPNSAFRNPKYSAVSFDALVSDEQQRVCRSVAVGGVQVWQHCQILWDCLCVRVCVCGAYELARRDGGALWLIWKWRERVVSRRCRWESRQGARNLRDSLWASAAFDLAPSLPYSPYYSIEHTLTYSQSCNTGPQFTWMRLLTCMLHLLTHTRASEPFHGVVLSHESTAYTTKGKKTFETATARGHNEHIGLQPLVTYMIS